MADIVFAFDPAIDRSIAVPDAAPPAVASALAAAPLEAVRAAFAAARDAEATALVLFGRVLDPQRASPAQAATLRSLITDLSAAGCHTVWVSDEPDACPAIRQMLGEPRGLLFSTPLQPVQLDLRGRLVEIVCGSGAVTVARVGTDDALPDGHRIVVGWDRCLWNSDRWDEAAAVDAPRMFAGWLQPGTHAVWGSRQPRVTAADIHPVAPLQPRSAHETTSGGVELLSLIGFDGPDFHGASGRWRTVPTQQIVWRTLSVASATGGDEELAATIWSALESLPTDPRSPLQIVRCSIECGTSVARRVRVAELAAETLARVRDLFDRQACRAWCEEVCAAPGESLEPLGHARSGGRPGSTTSFSSALADIVTDIERQAPPVGRGDGLAMPADLAREAGWLALELIESA